FAEQSTAEPVSVENAWDIELALSRVGGDQALLADLAKIFCEQSPKLLSAIETSIAEKNLPALKRGAHSIRSAISTFAAQRASDIAAELEESSRPEGFDQYRETFSTLKALVEELQSDLQKLSASNDVPAANSLVPGR
ncbi:MAG TPA: Hpt domain-containing protein, partial [Candidatus Acidoferrales bacterium]|nr:Hpt domain-containing protein [Candidatus Acidoferrales bacterium]